MKAIGKYIVVVRIEEDVTTDGLLLSGKDKEEMRYRRAIVKSPGTEVTAIKEGDKISYDTRNAFSMIIEGESYTVISERDVVLIED